MKVWYDKPAQVWEEALPLGNGRMGAMVFGGTAFERIQVNEESVWYGGPTDRINPDAAEHLGEIRELIFSGEIEKARKLLDLTIAACPDSMHPYQTLGDIKIAFAGAEEVQAYERSLELDSAVSRVNYKSGEVSFERTMFLSYPDDCMVMRMAADRKRSISFVADLSRYRVFTGVDQLAENGISLYGDLGQNGSVYVSGIRAWAKGGSVKVVGRKLCVKDADEVLLLFCADCSWHYPEMRRSLPGASESVKNKLQQIICDRMEAAAQFSFEELMERHCQDYQSLFGRVHLALEGSAAQDGLPTDQRLALVAEGKADTGLDQMLFDFGRYLLISSSREGGLPANLQGIWNQELTPPWESKYTININAEMNYWPAECCNLSECHMPLFDLLERMLPSGRENARRMYGCRGFMAHHNTDIHGDCAPQDTWFSSTYWVLGAAWMCTHVWTHFAYTRDYDFLEKYYPILCEASLFFLDFLVEKDGCLVTCPSISPENVYRLENGQTGAVTYGATMDNQILRDLFTQCLEAGAVLEKERPQGAAERGQRLAEIGIEDEAVFRQQVEATKKRLMPTRISDRGTILEWVEDYEEVEPGHRHISHLYGLYPSEQITMDENPELAAAARKTLEGRLSHGGGHTGWSRAWIMNHYTKLWDGEAAYDNLQKMLALSTYPNLFDKHPPFQIDGNFGAVSAIAQMLVQSYTGRIVLLPALPKAWGSGSVSGLRVQGNAEISLSWENSELTACRLTAHDDFACKVLYRSECREICLKKGESRDVAFNGWSNFS